LSKSEKFENKGTISVNFDKLSLDGSEEKGNKLRTYRKLKEKYEIENFLKLDIVRSDVSNFIRISISNSTLMIEKGKYKKEFV
jgi:hypothetical protein